MIYYLGFIFIYLTCLFKWKNNNNLKNSEKKDNNKNDIVEQTMKDYSLNRSNLISVEKPIPKINDNDLLSNPVELDDIDDISSSKNYINNKDNKDNIANEF